MKNSLFFIYFQPTHLFLNFLTFRDMFWKVLDLGYQMITKKLENLGFFAEKNQLNLIIFFENLIYADLREL